MESSQFGNVARVALLILASLAGILVAYLAFSWLPADNEKLKISLTAGIVIVVKEAVVTFSNSFLEPYFLRRSYSRSLRKIDVIAQRAPERAFPFDYYRILLNKVEALSFSMNNDEIPSQIEACRCVLNTAKEQGLSKYAGLTGKDVSRFTDLADSLSW